LDLIRSSGRGESKFSKYDAIRFSSLIRVLRSLQENGLLHVPKGQASNPSAQMFSDPNMAMDMMKKNLSMIIPQVSVKTFALAGSNEKPFSSLLRP
jgi:hypothetical protein